MKVLLLTLLLLLCSTQVLTIRCYTCTGGDDSCTMEVDFPENHTCMVQQHNGIVSRSCNDNCKEDEHTSCCKEDYCNGP